MASLTTILASDRVSDSRAVINTNFTNLNTDKAEISGALTQFVGNGNWKLFYSNGSGDIVELALGASGKVLQSNGAAAAPSFETVSGGTVGPGTINELAYFDTTTSIASLAVATYPSLTELSYVKGVTSAIQTQLNAKGTGNVSKVGTPVNNQIGIWTGDGTLEGDANVTYDSGTSILSVPGLAATAIAATVIDGIIGSDTPAAGTFTSLTSSGTLIPSTIQGGTGTNTTVVASAQYLGSTTTSYHWRNGAVALTVGVGNNYTALNLLSQDVTEAASGTHTLMANIAIGALNIIDGAGATTNAATVYIEGAATGTATPSNNYALWVDDGVTRLDGNLLLSGLTASEIVITDASKNLVSAAVATYPSLTELTYVKGVTSAIQTQINTKANSSGSLTQFVGNTAWRVFYSDGSGDIIELALGADGTFLKSNGAAAAPTFATPTGSGDVSKVGTPVDNQVGVWTGDGTLEGDAALTFNTTTNTLATTDLSLSNDLLLASASIINFNSGDVTLTHSLNTLTIDGGIFNANADMGLRFGGTLHIWNGSDNSEATIANTGGSGATILVLTATDTRLSAAGTNASSVVTVGGTQTLTSKSLTSPTITTASLSGTQLLAEGASIGLDPVASADGAYSGITITATAGYTQAFGDVVYLDPTDSRWEACDANSASGADGDSRGIVGIVVVAGTDGTACTILLQGVIRADAKFPTFTVNAPIYISETAGASTNIQPTTSGVVIRVLGFGLDGNTMYFNPSPDYITHV